MGQVVDTLPQGKPVYSVTSLDDEIYLLRPRGRDEVEVYDIISYKLLRCLTVPPNCRDIADIMTICAYYRCAYISDGAVECIHKLGLHDGATTQWLVDDKPAY